MLNLLYFGWVIFVSLHSSVRFLSGSPYDGRIEQKWELSQRYKWNIILICSLYRPISTKISYNYFVFYFNGSFTDRKCAGCSCILQKQNSENSRALFHSEHSHLWFSTSCDYSAVGDKWCIPGRPLVGGRSTRYCSL